jgi:FkbM family methyltransferase
MAGLITVSTRHRGFYQLAKYIGRSLPETQEAMVRFENESHFRFRLGDPFWSRVLCDSYKYEVALYDLLSRSSCLHFSFYDLGANYGYWSIRCSDSELKASQVVAVEASPWTFRHLELNRELNRGKFITLHRAIYSCSGETVFINEDLPRHGARHVEENGQPGCEVESITVDDLLKMYPPTGPAVVKLDVEGAEVPAFEGATDTFKGDTLIIYEDHYSDFQCRPSAWLFHNTCREIYHVRTGQRVYGIDDVRASKATRDHDFATIIAGSVFTKAVQRT